LPHEQAQAPLTAYRQPTLANGRNATSSTGSSSSSSRVFGPSAPSATARSNAPLPAPRPIGTSSNNSSVSSSPSTGISTAALQAATVTPRNRGELLAVAAAPSSNDPRVKAVAANVAAKPRVQQRSASNFVHGDQSSNNKTASTSTINGEAKRPTTGVAGIRGRPLTANDDDNGMNSIRGGMSRSLQQAVAEDRVRREQSLVANGHGASAQYRTPMGADGTRRPALLADDDDFTRGIRDDRQDKKKTKRATSKGKSSGNQGAGRDRTRRKAITR
jgi:hypothetical protein